MAGRWMKSLQCKSRAADDVYTHVTPLLPTSSSCRNSFQGLKDVVARPTIPKPVKPKPESAPPPSRFAKSKSVPVSVSQGFLPSLLDLPEGHPSRNVVEIIFQTRWGPKTGSAFPGRVEMVFKINNSGKTLTRFEEYRESVKARSGPDSVRCAADGNEKMRFYCLGPTASDGGCGASWEINGGGKGRIGTFSGSGAAHDSVGVGKGRRAMLVCRVIAGRVGKRVGEVGPGKGYDSVSGGNGELLVFDARAVLPCFLVIYKL